MFGGLVSQKAPFIAIFSAEKDEKGDTWCPDCKSAAPFYPEVVENARKRDMKVYMFYVGPREVYKTPTHPFRTHKLIKLRSIPTLAYYDGSTFSRRLEEGEILDKEMHGIIF